MCDISEDELSRLLGSITSFSENCGPFGVSVFGDIVDKHIEQSSKTVVSDDREDDNASECSECSECSDRSDIDIDDYHRRFYLPELILSGDAAPPKKTVGRPSKIPRQEPPPAPGLLDKPRIENNIMEFESFSIKELKQFLTVVNSFKCDELRIEFRRHDIKFMVPMPDGSITHFFHVSTERSFAYYCERPFSVYVEVGEIKRSFNRLSDKSDRLYIEQNKDLLNNCLRIGLRRGVADTIDTLHVAIKHNIKRSFAKRELGSLDNFPLIIEMRATELKSIAKSEKNKNALCFFQKTHDCEDVKINIKCEGSPDREAVIMNCPKTNTRVIARSDKKIIVGRMSIVALTRCLMHPPTDTVSIYIPDNIRTPIIVGYKNEKIFMHTYIYDDAI